MTDRQTDRQTDRRTDARGKTICLPTLKGGDIINKTIDLGHGILETGTTSKVAYVRVAS